MCQASEPLRDEEHLYDSVVIAEEEDDDEFWASLDALRDEVAHQSTR